MSTRPAAEFSGIPNANMTSSRAPARATYRKHWLLMWIGGIFAVLTVTLFVASFFLDNLIRVRTYSAMNQRLKGYRVLLARAHLQLIGGRLTLSGLKII